MSKNRKQQIVEKAIECLARYGPLKTNSNLVAKELKIQPSNVFYYFPKQEDLFAEMVKTIVVSNNQVVSKLLDEDQSYYDKAKRYLEGNLIWAKTYPEHVATLLSGVSQIHTSNEQLQFVSVALQTGEERLFEILAKGFVEGQLELKFEVKETAKMLHQVLMGCLIRMYTMQDDQALSEFTSRLFHFFDMIVKEKH